MLLKIKCEKEKSLNKWALMSCEEGTWSGVIATFEVGLSVTGL